MCPDDVMDHREPPCLPGHSLSVAGSTPEVTLTNYMYWFFTVQNAVYYITYNFFSSLIISIDFNP